MPEEKPTIHIDTDWKRQAQEEKKRLAEEESKKAAAAPSPPITSPGVAPTPSSRSTSPTAARGRNEPIPPASFPVLIQSLMTQTLFYLGELSSRGQEGQINLDMAKHQIDTLGVLEEKTRNNLTDEEKRMLDTVLYELRMRYVTVASQYT